MNDPMIPPAGGFGDPQSPVPDGPSVPEAPAGPDALGWALVGVPAAAGLAEMFLPDLSTSSLVSFVVVPLTLVLIGVDARRRGQSVSGQVVPALLLWIVFYPVYMRRRARWGAPNRLPFALLAVGLYILGIFYHPLAEPDRVLVRCVPTGAKLGEGFSCTVERPSGRRSVKACWDLVLVCATTSATAHVCQHAPPHAPTPVEVPFSAFDNGNACVKHQKTEVHAVVVEAD